MSEAAGGSGVWRFENVVVDTTARRVTVAGEACDLEPKSYRLLTFLIENRDRALTKEEIFEGIWNGVAVTDNALTRAVAQIRKALGDDSREPRYIETIPTVGYRFIAPVQEVAATETIEFAPQESAALISGGYQADTVPDASTSLHQRPNAGSMRLARRAGILGAIVVVGAFAAYFMLRGPASSPTDQPAPTRIAVLPFKPIVAGDRNEALELGMSDALIDKLNAGERIIVSPLSSIRRYGSLEQDPTEAGRQLNVNVVVDGSVQRLGDRIRISARLLQVKDGKQLWAQQFDEKFTDIFAVQDSISRQVADALKVRLGATRRYTDNAEAYGLYLKARYLSEKASMRDIQAAIRYLEEAVHLDPNYAPAYVVLADAHRAAVLIGDEAPSVAMPLAKQAALRAVELDDNLAEAHAALGWMMFWYDWDWAGAERELKRALQMDPRSFYARQFYAHLLSNTGRHTEAMSEIDKALEVEPLSLRANSLRGVFFNNAGRFEEGIAQFRKVLDLQPNYRLAQMFLCRALNERAEYQESLSAIRQVQIVSKEASEPRAIEADTLARMGRRKEAQAILNALLNESKTRYVPNYSLASIYAALGEPDEALSRLEKAFSEKDLVMVFLLVDPRWNHLHSNPRFINLLNRMRFRR